MIYDALATVSSNSLHVIHQFPGLCLSLRCPAALQKACSCFNIDIYDHSVDIAWVILVYIIRSSVWRCQLLRKRAAGVLDRARYSSSNASTCAHHGHGIA